MNKKGLIALVVILLIVIIALVVYSNRSDMVMESNTQNQTMPVGDTSGSQTTSGDISVQAGVSVDSSTTKGFTVNASNFKFLPATMSVNKGDIVKITLVNDSGVHDLKIDEYNVATKKLQAGQQETITFVADKTGTFEYYCSIGDHRAMGMKGTLTVK